MRPSRALLALFMAATLVACGNDVETDPGVGGQGDQGSQGGQGGEGSQGGGGQGGAGVAPPLAGAGSRLVPRTIDGGDGAEVWFDFFDNELGAPCSFMETLEGLRCVPKGLVSPLSGVAYLDASCTEPAVEVTACNGERYAAIHEPDACVGSIVVEVLAGEEETVEVTGSTSWGGSSCDASDELRTLRPATVLELTELVLGTIEVVDGAGELGVRRLVGDDGSFAVVGLTRGGNACTPREIDGESRCVDDVLALSAGFDGRLPLYTDASCLTEAAMVPVAEGCAAPTPGLAARAVQDEAGCAFGREYHRVGDPVATVYGASTGMCHATPLGDQVAFGLGEVVEATALPAVETAFVGDGRLAAAVREVDGTAIFADVAAFQDTELDTRCAPTAVVGGGLRCIPGPSNDPGQYNRRFADPTCDELLYPASDPQSCEEPPRFTAIRSEDSCGVLVAEVLERGALHEGATYWFDPKTGCGQVQEGDFYTIAARHPVTDFAPLEVRAPGVTE